MTLRTTVVGSYPLPGWLEHAMGHLDDFGPDDREELADDAVTIAVMEQVRAGLDTITDGEPTRFDFNLSFYGFLEGIDREVVPPRRFGPPAHDQRGKHDIVGELSAPRGLGVVAEWERLRRLAPVSPDGRGPSLKVSVPGPYTLSGRLVPNATYPDRWAVTEALLPLVRAEIAALVAAGAPAITVDEPSMSCYGWKEDVDRMVDVFNRTVEPAVGKARLGTHLCFGNFKGHPVGKRTYVPLFPAFLGLDVDEIHVEMANREMAELECIAQIADAGKDVAVGVVDVKSYYVETAEDVAARAKQCLAFVPPARLLLAPDCGLSQTARWAARRKLEALCDGARMVNGE
jgi:5-methyltetrahydropteroyltriglutamate--homocysteine methyltransferase